MSGPYGGAPLPHPTQQQGGHFYLPGENGGLGFAHPGSAPLHALAAAAAAGAAGRAGRDAMSGVARRKQRQRVLEEATKQRLQLLLGFQGVNQPPQTGADGKKR
eukprot:CAMPEP_0173398886 /NCGR_PEP_ID=MMETSP1356-20130122/43272_1 /TAXON_ID=77927 ORGANISM="Hemiselmis virescens, Strain PCC157" /NCGR_SAMPLE_ID=MMETSP1356 /ASSEMBLY_ACC=CAM_ASM_000847 /LENGTH=103 /DNA_ID=CAMNT_0014358479 /DNA_START=59 /DNA_END=367 /DNA_ORIENTATION=-